MNKKSFLPLIMSVCIVAGIIAGALITKVTTGRQAAAHSNRITATGHTKIDALLQVINDRYVDTVDMSAIIEGAMPAILSELDPHSAYIPAEDLSNVNDDLAASFSGIGVKFTIQKDTIIINEVIKGGPSEKVGLLPGDRIVTIDDSTFVGKIVKARSAMRKLKGPEGSMVKLGILRKGENAPLEFEVIRGSIPVHSITSTYMITDKIGYIKIDKFAQNTYMEMLVSIARLAKANMQGLILDLRGNSGGYMGTAIQMANEFLPDNHLIVYTEGRCSPRHEYMSDGTGSSSDIPIVVLIDEGSASASEILSGAIQDNDRGLIIGRRSFGKGLVQQPLEFVDGSAIRITIARYHSPSGRCIQKPYDKGEAGKYAMDIFNRYEHGEFFSADSIKQDKSKKYQTIGGRTVYGGGGIMPDIFVPSDTTHFTSYFRDARGRGLILRYCFDFTDNHRRDLELYKDDLDGLLKYLDRHNIVNDFARYAEKKGLKRRNRMLRTSLPLFKLNLYGSIIYNSQGDEMYHQYLNRDDDTVERAVKELNKIIKDK